MKSSALLTCLLFALCGLSVHAQSLDVAEVLQSSVDDTYNLKEDEVKAALEEVETDEVAERVFAFLSSSKYIKLAGYTARAQLNAMKKVQKLTGLKGKALLEVMKEDFGCSVVPNKRVKIKSDTDWPLPQIGECPFPDIECDKDATYRTADGTCNNLVFPHDGRAERAFARFMDPVYADGIEEPKKAKNGKDLPSARNVSLTIFEDLYRPSGLHTMLHMTFGQVLDHDMDKTAIAKLMKPDGTLADFICGNSGCETEGGNNTECFPIPIPEGDPDFGNRTCLMFVRSQEFMKDGCEISSREQANTITSWIDASFVYGSSVEQMDSLRDLSNSTRGKLRVTDNSPHKPLLPQTHDKSCRDLDDIVKCFDAGDGRRNEQVGLIAMHTLFVRLHNHYEEQLHQRHPEWSGEKLFQESRRLLIAVWQNIVYNEYLPILFGPTVMKKYKLKLQKKDRHFEGYDPSVHGDVTSVFATSAFRFGHSQIPGLFRFSDNQFENHVEVLFSSVLFLPRTVYHSLINGTSPIDAIVFGMISQPVEAPDRFMSREVTVKLFSKKGAGTDLGALNLQRGRDHGIPGYTLWRKWCDLSVPEDFDDLHDIPPDARAKFEQVYEHVEDIELFAAGLAEYPVEYGIVGPTFACILAHQFRNTKVADRFWFETNDPQLKYSPEQLKNIHQITLSRVFCDTLDDVDKIQKYSMLQPKKVADATGVYRNPEYLEYINLVYKDDKNKRVPCEKLKNIDFSLW